MKNKMLYLLLMFVFLAGCHFAENPESDYDIFPKKNDHLFLSQVTSPEASKKSHKSNFFKNFLGLPWFSSGEFSEDEILLEDLDIRS